MNCRKSDKHISLTLTEAIVKWILSNIKDTPEYLLKEIEKYIRH